MPNPTLASRGGARFIGLASRAPRGRVPATVTFIVDPNLASIVRPGVLWFDGATVVEHDHRLDAPLAAAEAAVRINPPVETTAVRTMYKRVGHRSDQDAAVVRSAAAPRAQGRPAAAHQLDGRRLQLVLVRISAAVRPLRRGADSGRRDAAHRSRGRIVSGHPQGRCARGRTNRARRRGGPFGNPTSDSARTMVTTATTRATARGVRAARRRHGAADARHGHDVRADAAVHRLSRARAPG